MRQWRAWSYRRYWKSKRYERDAIAQAIFYLSVTGNCSLVYWLMWKT